MAAKQGIKPRKSSLAKGSKDTAGATEKFESKAKHVVRAQVKEKAKLKSEDAMVEAQKAVTTTHGKDKHKRQARIRSEKALVKSQDASSDRWLEAEQKHQAPVKHVSFVVRSTIDAQGQLARTEIEHVSSGRKQNFVSLDGESVVNFLLACTGRTITPKSALSPDLPLREGVTPTSRNLRPKSSLIVSGVRLCGPGVRDPVNIILAPQQPFLVQAHFLLQGPEACPLTSQEYPYEMKVFVEELTGAKSRLLTTYRAKLIRDVLEYTGQVKMTGLPNGLYRLTTIVILSAPSKIGGFYGKTFVDVI